jgi:hypothetical protein
MTNPSEIKAIAGNSASCLGYPIALSAGSSPVLLAKEGPGIERETSKIPGPSSFQRPGFCFGAIPVSRMSPEIWGAASSSRLIAASLAAGDRCMYRWVVVRLSWPASTRCLGPCAGNR